MIQEDPQQRISYNDIIRRIDSLNISLNNIKILS